MTHLGERISGIADGGKRGSPGSRGGRKTFVEIWRARRVDNYGSIHYAGPHCERNVGTGADTTEVVTKFYYAQMGNMKRLIALRRAGTLYYVVPDHLGGTLRVVDVAGNTVDDIRYHVFGGQALGRDEYADG